MSFLKDFFIDSLPYDWIGFFLQICVNTFSCSTPSLTWGKKKYILSRDSGKTLKKPRDKKTDWESQTYSSNPGVYSSSITDNILSLYSKTWIQRTMDIEKKFLGTFFFAKYVGSTRSYSPLKFSSYCLTSPAIVYSLFVLGIQCNFSSNSVIFCVFIFKFCYWLPSWHFNYFVFHCFYCFEILQMSFCWPLCFSFLKKFST